MHSHFDWKKSEKGQDDEESWIPYERRRLPGIKRNDARSRKRSVSDLQDRKSVV